MADLNCETTDVVICGCGPTGAMLSAYLGRMRIRNIVLEKGERITTDPRGIALDEDGIRLLQGIGLYPSIYKEIGTCMHTFKFIGGTNPVLDKKAFMEMDYGTTEGGTGHVGFICHKQPTLEKSLRQAMASSSSCELRSGCTVTGLSEDEDGVICQYRDPQGIEHCIRSRFFVGADGKTGFTRKQYLEARGITMDQAHSAFYEETWVALNWKIDLPNEKTHPDFPLWKMGYTPEQVYELFFPLNFRFICNPNRPSVCGRFGLPADRLWRFEFVVLKDEDGDKMAEPEMMKKVVFPYITHSGSRYGLSYDIAYPEDCITVLRCRPFRFSARSCNRWSNGRVILCGDSAHVFPPFGGQGIASGFRDAASLAWRLALLCRDTTPSKSLLSHEKVLEAWYMERKQQLERSLASTIENGRFVTEGNPVKIFLRNLYLWIVQLVPSWRHDLRLGRRKEGMVRYKHFDGMPFLPELNGGLSLPQVYCTAVNKADAEIQFTDDVIFAAHKECLFQLLVYVKTLDEMADAKQVISDIDDISNGEIRASEATFLVEDLFSTSTGMDDGVFRLATGDEFAQSLLCEGRPAPQFYDPYSLGKELNGTRFVIVRPDRFIFAACNSREDLRQSARCVVSFLQG
ncbi:hypothetical protein N7474_006456 [Penicillium riverlandense]|uniref:uncharacterized protein n=1 Tax=Penicillium riverlandense TaxID=1903569 RepID=UPI00254766E0|nr:uncharacterized protein N7474_006456 [Penicillium riverlandense]KAJ5814679.1 hypothetical protein N7474_006456 [Penicillium riverlandense]